MYVRIKKIYDNVKVPEQVYEKDVGLDLACSKGGWILPFQRKLFKTGLAVQPESGYEMQIRPRSGLALKKGITVLNSPATIEPTFTGEIAIILYNTSLIPFKVVAGDRIAQVVFKQYEESIDIDIVDNLNLTERGQKGFGQSGIK